MRSLLAALFSWFMPARVKPRALTQTQHTFADSPTVRLTVNAAHGGVERPAARSISRPPEFLRGEDLALIRPYLILHERAHGIYHEASTHEAGWVTA